jgi:hypothetical protein
MPNLHQDKSNDPVKASANPKTIEIMLNSDGNSDNPLNQALLR